MKTLIVDIETSPCLALVWGAWKQNVSEKQFLQKNYIMSFAAKWLGEEDIHYYEARERWNERAMLEQAWKLLDEADVVVAHNAKKFDIPFFEGRFVIHEMTPPSPYKVDDTLITAKRRFRLPSNSLESLANDLGLSPKSSHAKFAGFELWKECLKGNPEAWEEMRDYNIQDILTLEEIYLRILPWSTQTPNHNVYSDSEELVCPKCGSSHIQKRGFAYTGVSKFQQFACMSCGSWGRGRKNLHSKEKMETVGLKVQ